MQSSPSRSSSAGARSSAAAAIVIGRNEARRLDACLRAVTPLFDSVVYVDSGSVDQSVSIASSHAVAVIALDDSVPHCAARARNSGLARIRALGPHIRFLQFVDGDTILHPTWATSAIRALESSPDVAAVFGALHEEFPQASIYNRVCEVEWNRTPPGECAAFPGIVMVRIAAFDKVGGYDSAVLAAEDDELSIRMRRAGWRILRLDGVMGWHDARLSSFAQWWRRAARTGYAFAQVHALHGGPPEHYFRRDIVRTLLWAVVVPGAGIVGLCLAPRISALSVALLYASRAARAAIQCRRAGWSTRTACAWGALSAIASFAHLAGLVRFWLDGLFRRRRSLIEHKA